MRKQPEIEEMLKRFIRDELARDPWLSVEKMRMRLYRVGWKTVHGPLDWAYINKLMKKVRFENLARLGDQTRMERLSQLRERHRIITQKLMDIVDGKPRNDIYADRLLYPSYKDRSIAADTIMKWDTALLFAEEQFRVIDAKLHKTEFLETNTALLNAPKQRWMRAAQAPHSIEISSGLK